MPKKKQPLTARLYSKVDEKLNRKVERFCKRNKTNKAELIRELLSETV